MAAYYFQEKLFNTIHQNNLIYNSCWEDPRCDRELLQLQADSQVVMITSAGCNALDYLLDDPEKIFCVDMNYRQNALLELKLAALTALAHDDFFAFFGTGKHQAAAPVYKKNLKPLLLGKSETYWNKHIHFFNGRGVRPSFYYYGTAGFFAWLFTQFLRSSPRLKNRISALFSAKSLEEQKAVYEQIEPIILNKFISWILEKPLTLSLLGVPKSQHNLLKKDYKKGVSGFLQEKLRQVFVHQPLNDNYFWYLYTHGRYSKSCCPNYLLKENHGVLKERISRISTTTQTISGFLKDKPGVYSHYVLLDHQDWLAANDKGALQEEWALILKNSKSGTRILLRSAGSQVTFIPAFVKERVWFENEKTLETHQKDRVGTYGSVVLAIVR